MLGYALQRMAATAFAASVLVSLGRIQCAHAADIRNSNGFPESSALGPAGPLANGATLCPLDECPIRVTGDVTCANLTVPERRDTLHSRMITVRVTILHAPKQTRQPDPFVFLMGGQGQGYSVLGELATLPGLLQRDVITLEQRGTQLADTFDGCPGLKSGGVDIDQILTSQPTEADVGQIELCKTELERANIDRDAYDTEASADDIWDLKQLLDVDQWNIFGVSYGGRTAESFLRKHPNAARSLVLDSPQVTGIPLIFGYARLMKIGSFFARCAAADGCGRQFPDLKDQFERTVARLERDPVPVLVSGRRQFLNSRAYIRIITWILYSEPELFGNELPAAVVAASEGNYASLLALEERYSNGSPPEPYQPGDYPFSLGTHIAQQTQMLCSEEYPYVPHRDGQIHIPVPDGWAPAVQRVAVEEQRMQAWVCRQWDVEPSDPHQGHLPPHNDIPTLVVNGEHDTLARSEDQDLLALSYPRSTRVVFPWTGHAIIERRQACFLPMLAAFITSPEASVNTSCALEVKEPQWLPQAPQATHPASYLPMMQTVAANQVRDFGFPGRTVYINLHRAHVRGTVAVGLADPATGRPLTGREPSRMASMTKTYTAAAVLRLVEAGKVNLDKGVAGYLTEETKQLLQSGGYDPCIITVRQLLQHTSSIPDYVDNDYELFIAHHPQHRWTRREQVQWALDRSKPTGEPGEVFAYSDTGYVLLGEIIEQASGFPQARAYRQLLGFDRLGLRHTWFETLEPAPTDLPPRAHQFYGTLDTTAFDPSFDLWGGGGLVATAEDEGIFLRALMTGRVFGHSDTLTTMLTVPATNEKIGYGMGILRVNVDGVLCWGHAGHWGTSFYHCPSEDVTMASDRYQGITPQLDYDPQLILATALRINRLVLHPAVQLEAPGDRRCGGIGSARLAADGWVETALPREWSISDSMNALGEVVSRYSL